MRTYQRIAACAVVALAIFVHPAAGQDLLCDPAERDASGRDCRDILISHIRQEKVALDVAFWFMEDAWIASEVIARKNAGVPVRVLADTRANVSTPRNADRLAELAAAGIPMRERFASGILHWKMMLFEGQGIVQFSGANYSSDAWTVSGDDYTNYVDEAIIFTSKPSIVNSFRTKYDDLWVNTTQYRDYANINAPLVRSYGIHPIDPELNFVPWESHAVRAIAEYEKETRKIDVIMYRITDSRYADAMIAAHQRGIPVRLLTEPLQYRDPIRQYHSWNIDRMYKAGIEIRHRAHPGLNHQKSVILYNEGMTITGSSNWSSASSESQEEHNVLTKDPLIFQWFVDQFERKWTNSTGLPESEPFVPLPADKPAAPAPANQETGVATDGLVLRWNGGYWAHKYDVYLGTAPGALTAIATNVPRSSSGIDYNSYTLKDALLPGTTYYWKVVAKTMADVPAESSVWTFSTAGTAPQQPPPPSITVARQPYLQQVTAASAIIVWATRESGAAEVRYTVPGGSTVTVGATSTLYPASTTGLAADYYQHEATLTGLSPSTTYPYDILVSGVDLNPQADTVTTAPVAGSGTVRFVAFGDSGTGSTAQQQIAARLTADSFDFAMHGGDVAYGNSSGTGGATHQTMDDWFFTMYKDWLRSRPMFPSMGNHDSRLSNLDGKPYKDLFVLPTGGGAGAYPDHAERYYSFDYGPVHVVVLDTELAFQDTARRDAQLAWLHADLASTTQPWKLALFHRSPYSAGGEHGSDLTVRSVFGGVFDQYGVQLVISAHEHDYERTKTMRAGQVQTDGTVYLVSGGGGGPLYAAATDFWTAYSASVYHYVKGTATECTLRVDAIDAQGAVFDSVSLQRCEPPPDTQAPTVAVTSPPAGATVSGDVTVQVSATDDVGVASVALLVDGAEVATDTTSPFSFIWQAGSVANGAHTLAARATDAAGNSTLSAVVSVNVLNAALGEGDILLYTADAVTLVGNWTIVNDPTAAGGRTARNPDTGMAKRTTAHAAPADYLEMTFTPQVNVAYRLWMRGKAQGDVYYNDSVHVQFTGTSQYLIGTTSSAEYNLEDCSGCRISGWGWQDNGWGVGVLGPTITFTTAGPHTIRIQPREDGLSIDQILLSPSKFLNTAPGALKNDTTIYPRSAGTVTPPPPDTEAPTAAITAPASGATVSGVIAIDVNATDNVAVTQVALLVDGTSVQTDTTAPFGFSWNTAGVSNGSHTLQVVARDAAGNTGPSATITVMVDNTVQPPPNAAPQVSLTAPVSGARYTAPATIDVAASATDSDGTIAKVDFYAGTTLIGSDSTSPYAITWTGVAEGSYTLTARAIDNAGAATTSAGVSVTVSAPVAGLPSPWTSQDIGAVGPAGSATASNGVFTIKGGGADIWGTADAFHFMWQRVAGDVDVFTRVASVEYVHQWVKAGVMIRERLTADSAHGMMLVSPGKGLAFQRRVVNGGLSTSTSGGSGTAPAWVKLSRRGNTLSAYRSADGVNWTLVGSDTFTMPSEVYVGLMVTSHDVSRLATATFDNVTVVTSGSAPPPPNVAPTVSLTEPAEGSQFTSPATIALAASAADSDGTVVRVDFYAGATLVGSDTTAPFQTSWSNVQAGSYTITARALDDDGAATTSAGVTVTVAAPAPVLPSPWSAQDIGAVGVAGTASASNGLFTITGAGADIWSTADAFHYVWQPLTGDADVIARVTSVEYVHQWVKAGVMIRESLTPQSAHAFMLVSPGKGLAFQRRVTTGGLSTHTTGGSGTAPAWVKLERRGNTITAYRSADGVSWTVVGSDSFSMGTSVYVGLAVSSHTTSTAATATIDNVIVTPK